jgi:hypothetical protein
MWRGWRHIQNLCGFLTPTAMGQSFIMTLYIIGMGINCTQPLNSVTGHCLRSGFASAA